MKDLILKLILRIAGLTSMIYTGLNLTTAETTSDIIIYGFLCLTIMAYAFKEVNTPRNGNN